MSKLIALSEEMGEIGGMPEINYGTALIRMLFALGICIGLLILTVWLLRRMMSARIQRGTKDQAIQLLEKRMISPKSTLYLIEIEGKRVLLAESQLEIRPIHELESSPLRSGSE
jgi:flagellar biogenesis protein FliO